MIKVDLFTQAADIKYRNVRSAQEMTAMMTVIIIKQPGQNGQHLGKTWPVGDFRQKSWERLALAAVPYQQHIKILKIDLKW